ncbi:MAG: hypothetical protein M0Z46_08880 [Actinomycetota bacterium]|nr:hypothetical protein [Actinomycetota bacterium]
MDVGGQRRHRASRPDRGAAPAHADDVGVRAAPDWWPQGAASVLRAHAWCASTLALVN